MSRTWLAAAFFVLGLLAGVFVALQLRPAFASSRTGTGAGSATSSSSIKSTQALDLQIRSGGTYRVRSVIDGDTIVLENGLHLRYSGVNAPESGRFVRDPAPKAADATARNRELVEGRDVRVELAREPLDLHGRALGRIYIKEEGSGEAERDVSEILVREGLARAMTISAGEDEGGRLRDAQVKAKAERAGIWAPVVSSANENHDAGVAVTPSGLPEGVGARTGQHTKAFVSANGSSLYHAASCMIARRIRPTNVRGYATRAEAEAAGLTACKKCATKTETLGTE